MVKDRAKDLYFWTKAYCRWYPTEAAIIVAGIASAVDVVTCYGLSAAGYPKASNITAYSLVGIYVFIGMVASRQLRRLA